MDAGVTERGRALVKGATRPTHRHQLDKQSSASTLPNKECLSLYRFRASQLAGCIAFTHVCGRAGGNEVDTSQLVRSPTDVHHLSHPQHCVSSKVKRDFLGFLSQPECENTRRLHQTRTGKCAVVKCKGCTVYCVIDLINFWSGTPSLAQTLLHKEV